MVKNFIRHAALLTATLAGTAAAQTPAADARPNLVIGNVHINDSEVRAVLRLPDGGALVGGDFAQVEGHLRNNLVRIRADGTVDATWLPPSTNGTVDGLALSGDGGVIIWGGFTRLNGVTRTSIAKLDLATAALNLQWNPAPSGGFASVRAVQVRDGTAFVSGSFTSIGGLPRNGIARLSASGTAPADAAWNANLLDGAVTTLAIDATGDVYAGGTFNEIGGAARNKLAKLSGASGNALAWNAAAGASSITRISALALSADGSALYFGGSFSQINGLPRNGLAKAATASGTLDTAWNPGNSGTSSVSILVPDSDGLYALGSFSALGGQSRDGAAKLALNGTGAALPWDVGQICGYICAAGSLNAAALLGTDELLIGGDIHGTQASTRFSLLRVGRANADLRPRLDATQLGHVNVGLRLPDGAVILGGEFVQINGQRRFNLARLTPSGALDLAWAPYTDDAVYALAADAQGRIYAGGLFGKVDGLSREGLVRISAQGTVDTSWNPGSNCCRYIYALTLAPGGQSLYVGGSFGSNTICGATRSNLAKLSTGASCAADQAFALGVTGSVYTIATADNGGTLYVGGNFSQAGGQARSHVARLNAASGAADAAWNPRPDGSVLSLLPLPGGAIYLGGSFSNIGDIQRRGAARLDAAGNVDLGWTANVNSSTRIDSLLLQDGALFAGGSFSSIRGANQPRLAKLSTTDGAVDTNWRPLVDGPLYYLSGGEGDLLAVGDFTKSGSVDRIGAARFSTGERIFNNGFQ